MNVEKAQINLKCEMLIDQGRYIGDDPVGHACFRDAQYQLQGKNEYDSEGPLICLDCVNMLKSEPHRITFPRGGYGPSYQTKIINEILNTRVSDDPA